MSSVSEYFSGLFTGIKSLLTGLRVTGKELVSKKVTSQYPENRATLVISPRFRAELTMPHDENNEHACTACNICATNCPNGTIKVVSKSIETEDGKKKRILDKYTYDLGMCTFCNLCVITCPSDAIKFSNNFENAMFRREGLMETLNKEGSKLREKKREPKPAVEKPAAPVTEAATKEPTEVKPEAKVVVDKLVVEESTVEKPISKVLESLVEAKSVEAKPVEDKSVAGKPVVDKDKNDIE